MTGRTIVRCRWMVMGVVLALCSTANAGPKISCSSPTFDFGSKDAGENVTATFVVANAGDQDLKIDGINPAAGNSIDKNVVAPGDHATVTVKLTVTGNGKMTRMVQVASNDPATRMLGLTLTGMAHLPVTIDPASIDFGTAALADAPAKVVTVSAQDPAKPFKIRSAGGPASLDVKTEAQADGVSYKIIVTPKRDGLAMDLRSSITLMTDNAAFGNLSIPVTGSFQADIHTSSPNIAIIRRADGVGQSNDFKLMPAKGENKFSVVSTSIAGVAGILYSALPAGDGKWAIRVSDVSKAVDLNGKYLDVTTDLGTMKQFRVPISDPGGRAAAFEWGIAAEGLQLSLQMPNPTFLTSANVTGTVMIRNVSDQMIRVAFGTGDLTVKANTAAGLSVDLTPAGKTQATRPAGATTQLRPGELRNITIMPKTVLDLSKPGTYIMSVELAVAKQGGKGTTVLASNGVTFQMKTAPLPIPPGLP